MDILVIEDDRLTLSALRHSITDLGHHVETADNAEEAINKIESTEYDLIISDIMMPGISGLSLITILRTVHLNKTPIIVISALNNKPLLEAAYEAGANDFIAKPYSLKDLAEKLKKYEKHTKV